VLEPDRPGSWGCGDVILDLLLIGLGITLVPFPLTAFVLMLGALKGT
jgi:hypothetical protein